MDHYYHALSQGPMVKLCSMDKSPSSSITEYGFVLRDDGQPLASAPFLTSGVYVHVIKIAHLATAHLAGLYPGDRILEVNYQSVEQESLMRILERIAENPYGVTMLVANSAALRYYSKLCVRITSEMPNILHQCSPFADKTRKTSTLPWPEYIQSHAFRDLSSLYSRDRLSSDGPTEPIFYDALQTLPSTHAKFQASNIVEMIGPNASIAEIALSRNAFRVYTKLASVHAYGILL